MESVISRTISESICRTIVHHYDFVVSDSRFSFQVTEALCKPFVACVVCAHDHRDPRKFVSGGKGNLSVDLSHDVEGELWASVTSREPKIPVFDLYPPRLPFIRPGKDEYSSAAPAKALRTCHSREAAWACHRFVGCLNRSSANSNGRYQQGFANAQG